MVDVRAVTCRFNGMTAVDRASLSLERGGFLTILGPSGCGKTTLLRMIAGFLRPDEGEIFVHGQAVSRVPAWRRSIGMVFQKLALFPHMTAAGNVAYPLKMRGFDRAEISDRVQRYLSIVRLEGLDSRRPHELSGGQQQRVAIARALVFEPDLLDNYGLAKAANADLARETGIPEVVSGFNGDMIRLAPGPAAKIDEVRSGRIIRDGRVILEADNEALKERRRLAFAGLVSVAFGVDESGEIGGDIEVELAGVPETGIDDIDIADMVLDTVEETVSSMPRKRRKRTEDVRESVRRAIRRHVEIHWGKKPRVQVFVIEL